MALRLPDRRAADPVSEAAGLGTRYRCGAVPTCPVFFCDAEFRREEPTGLLSYVTMMAPATCSAQCSCRKAQFGFQGLRANNSAEARFRKLPSDKRQCLPILPPGLVGAGAQAVTPLQATVRECEWQRLLWSECSDDPAGYGGERQADMSPCRKRNALKL